MTCPKSKSANKELKVELSIQNIKLFLLYTERAGCKKCLDSSVGLDVLRVKMREGVYLEEIMLESKVEAIH